MGLTLQTVAQTLTFPLDDGKHEDAEFEAWSSFSHLSNSSGDIFGVTIFFFSGKVIGINTSGIYVVVADEKNKVYKNISKIQFPLFSSTTHTVGRLLEDYSDNTLERKLNEDLYVTNIKIDNFNINLKFNLSKLPINIGELAVGDDNFNRAYVIPRGKVFAKMTYNKKEFDLGGIGIFQHQWGSKPEQSALSDIFAMHMSDSTDILIYHNKNFPEINKFILSDKDGKSIVDNKFIATSDTLFYDKASGKNFNLKWKFEIKQNHQIIEIIPNFDGQKIEMLGLNYWLSRCKVIKTVKNNSQNGIGYVYIGYEWE